VVAVDHDGREIKVELLRHRDAVERLDEIRLHLLAEGLKDLHHELAPAAQLCLSVRGLAAGLEPGGCRVPAAMGVRPHVWGATETGNAAFGDGRAVAGKIDLQGRADEHVTGIEAGGLTDQAVRPQRSVVAGEINVAARRYV